MQPISDFLAEVRRDNRPFFLWYAPMMPHTPHNPPQQLTAKYLPAAPSPAVAKYWAMIEWFDDTVGRLLVQLEEQGLAENTIVVFLADNGWITDPATGDFAAKSKTSPYDGGVRTPIIIRWLGHIRPEAREELAMSLDIAPTLLRAVGIDPTAEMLGIDLLDNRELQTRTSIFGECFTHTAFDLDRPAENLRWRWMIDGTWKMIVPDARNQPNDRVELYDIRSDEREEQNVAATHPEVTEQMRKKLDAWWSGE
jgi:arylsulfatase A-like enzyme